MTSSQFPGALDNLTGSSVRNNPTLSSVINAIQATIGTTGSYKFSQAKGFYYSFEAGLNSGMASAPTPAQTFPLLNTPGAGANISISTTCIGPIWGDVNQPYFAAPSFTSGSIAVSVTLFVTSPDGSNQIGAAANYTMTSGQARTAVRADWTQSTRTGTDLALSSTAGISVKSTADNIAYLVYVQVNVNFANMVV